MVPSHVPRTSARSRSQNVVVWVAILSSFVAFLDGSIVNVALPAMSADLGGGVATQQWVLDAYLLTLGSLILVAGAVSDSFGRVRVLRVGLILFGIASLGCALAPGASLLILARAVQGVGAALLVPSSLALISASFDQGERGRAIGMWTAWTGTAFIAGPLVGGILVDTLGWRWIFAINVAPILLTLALLVALVEATRPAASRVDVVGAALAAIGLAGPVFGLIEQQRLGWSHPAVLASLGGGSAALALFLWWEGRAPHPMMPLRLFRTRNFAVGNVATMFFYAGISLGLLLVTLFLQEVAGFTALQAGLATLPVALLPLFLSQLFGSLAGAHGPRLYMGLGPLVAGAGFLTMLTTTEPLNFWVQLLPGLLLFGVGLSITVAPLTAAILGAIDPRESGIGSAINNAVSRVAGLVVIAFINVIVGDQLELSGFLRGIGVASALLIAGGVVSWAGVRNLPIDSEGVPGSIP